MNAPVMAGCLGAPRPLSCLAKRCPPARNVRDTRSLARYTPSPRTGSGIHRTAKATADAPAEPWMPEHVRPDGRRFPVRPRAEAQYLLAPRTAVLLGTGFPPARDLCESFETAPAKAGAQLGGLVTDCTASPNWTPAYAGVVREHIRLLLSQRSRLRGNTASRGKQISLQNHLAHADARICRTVK